MHQCTPPVFSFEPVGFDHKELKEIKYLEEDIIEENVNCLPQAAYIAPVSAVIAYYRIFGQENVRRFRPDRLFQVQERPSFLLASDSEPGKPPSICIDAPGWL